jgi:hypothetical protein
VYQQSATTAVSLSAYHTLTQANKVVTQAVDLLSVTSDDAGRASQGAERRVQVRCNAMCAMMFFRALACANDIFE